MFKTIITAIALTVAATTAQAGWLSNITDKIKASNEAYNAKQTAYYTKRFAGADKDETILFDKQAVYVNVAGTVTRVTISSLRGTKDQKIAIIKEAVGNNIAGGLDDGFDSEGFNAETNEFIENSLADLKNIDRIERELDKANEALAAVEQKIAESVDNAGGDLYGIIDGVAYADESSFNSAADAAGYN